MATSLQRASNYIAKVHDAILRGTARAGIEVVPITDGAFLLSTSLLALQSAARAAMIRLACSFIHEASPDHRFLVRGGLAAGETILGRDLSAGFADPVDAKLHTRQTPLGVPIGTAYHAERKAPPFGFYVDPSARAPRMPLQPWPCDAHGYWPWWNGKDPDDVDRGRHLGKAIAEHYAAIGSSPTLGYDPKKMVRHTKRAVKYFPK
ncbi:MAG: hypothetical protein IT431_05155 [Phycisphaerales bacterium]|nr:hypothetical protein [Phycisphaerales bacterium]